MNTTVKTTDPFLPENFDSFYRDPCFDELLEAFNLLNNKKKVALVFCSTFMDSGQEMITTTFPFSMTEIHKAFGKLKKWQKIMAAAPHLFRTQKVIYAAGIGSGQLAPMLADRLFQNNYHKKILVLREGQLQYDFLVQEKMNKAVLFQEYRFNASRYFMELLKAFSKQGGSVFTGLAGKKEPGEDPGTENQAFRFSVHVPPDFVLVCRENNRLIRFFSISGELWARKLNQGNQKISKEEVNRIARLYFDLPVDRLQEDQLPAYPSLDTMAALADLPVHPLECTYAHTLPEDQFDLCQERFDEARQARIAYNRFCELFHRYGKGIEEITESAYELLDPLKNADEIWDQAEHRYQQKYEWKKQ